MKPIRAAIYGACHANALRQVLESDPYLSARVEFVPIASCMDMTNREMGELIDLLPSLDLFIYQPISTDYRGPLFTSASVLQHAPPTAQLLSFGYYHFEAYTPYITLPAVGFPESDTPCIDYLLGALIHGGLTDAQVVEGLSHFGGFEMYAPALLDATLSELRAREGRVLDGDRPVDIRLADRIERNFRSARLGHTLNHPTATVFKWLTDDVSDQLATRFGWDVQAPAPSQADPLGETSYFTAPFVAQAFDLTFAEAPRQRLNGREMSLNAYVARRRPYYEAIERKSFVAAVRAMSVSRPWYEALLDVPETCSSASAAGGKKRRQRDLTIPFDDGVKPNVLVSGWGDPDPSGVWSVLPTACIEISAPDVESDALLLQFIAVGHAPAPALAQTVEVSIAGELLATWAVRPAHWLSYSVSVPARLFERGGPLRLTLSIPDAARPSAGDPRLLGIAVQRLSISH
ncbi:MAG: WcbI family polysaccharide biosynthesis putative acetyltransferase [Caulobacteraceae bacterium]